MFLSQSSILKIVIIKNICAEVNKYTNSNFFQAVDYIKKDKTVKGDTTNLEELQKILSNFQDKLKKSDYNGHYFARTSIREDDPSYCNNKGWFRCEGLFDQKACDFEDHVINPYGSREQRILFSTWNLDHRYCSWFIFLIYF